MCLNQSAFPFQNWFTQDNETYRDKGLPWHLFNNFLQSDGLSSPRVSLQRFAFNVTTQTWLSWIHVISPWSVS